MKNYEIYNANNLLQEIAEKPLKGKSKFKIFNVKAELERKIQVVSQALEGVEDEEERKEILNERQAFGVEKLSTDDLEQIDLSMVQISALKPLIKEYEEYEILEEKEKENE